MIFNVQTVGGLFSVCNDFSTRPQFAAAWMNLGIVQAATKKFSQAEQSYQTALYHRHRYADCYFNLGNMVSGQNISSV